MASVLNKAQVKKELLALSQRHRRGMFTRVSSKVVRYLENYLREEMYRIVNSHRSVGKTIDP